MEAVRSHGSVQVHQGIQQGAVWMQEKPGSTGVVMVERYEAVEQVYHTFLETLALLGVTPSAIRYTKPDSTLKLANGSTVRLMTAASPERLRGCRFDWGLFLSGPWNVQDRLRQRILHLLPE